MLRRLLHGELVLPGGGVVPDSACTFPGSDSFLLSVASSIPLPLAFDAFSGPRLEPAEGIRVCGAWEWGPGF